jgi:tryptophanyl-tRNA synthetase
MSPKAPVRFLTGITTTGTPHLGNYVGALRPAVEASRRPGTENFYFLADYHALIKCDEPARVQRSTLEIAACWLAIGLDPEQVYFYRQSDIREIPELTWLLTCVTGKGLLNRAHAYKAQVDKNAAAAVDSDTDVTAGLFMYPVLMAADILMFKAHKIPVGRDQVQHIEMARDIAASFNHLYGEHLVLPEAAIDDSVALLPGTDGRKMSKSYDNVIPLFAPREQLRKQIAGIVTDSSTPGQPKRVEGSALFQIFEAFASREETTRLRQAYADGISWADAKQLLFERIDGEIGSMRERYDALVSNPAEIERILSRGAEKARTLAAPLMAQLKDAVGLRNLASQAQASKKKSAKAALPSFKQFREADGLHYFKLVDAGGRLLAQSMGFASPQEAGRAVAQLKAGESAPLDKTLRLADGVSQQDLQAAIAALANS